MENTQQGNKASDSDWMLFPLLLIAAVLVIVLSTLSVIALSGMIPNAHSNTVQPLEPLPEVQPQTIPPAAKPVRSGMTHMAARAGDVQ